MSTQDDTLYLRSKLATRRGRPDYGGPGGQWSSPPQFMKDGYVKWAESTRPAREGGAEKIPAEKQMPRKGGADILQIVDDMSKFYDQAKTYAPKVKSLLRNKTVQSKIAKGKYAPQMNQIAEYMDMVGLGHMKHDESMCRRVGGSKSFQEYALSEEGHGGRIGMGEGGRIGMGIHAMAVRHGGADQSVIEKLQKFGMEVYNWLKANKAVTKAVMESPYLNEKNPLGATELPRKIKGYMEKVGLGIEDDMRKQRERVESGMRDQYRGMEDYLASKRGKGIQDDFEGCPPGYVDDGLTCRKPITTRMKKQKQKAIFPGMADFEYDVPEVEGGEVIAKKYKGKGVVSNAQTAYKGYKMAKKLGLGGGRQPSEYAMFVKDFARKHPGPDLMKRAGAAWRSR